VGFKNGARLEPDVDQIRNRPFGQLPAFDSPDIAHHRCVFDSGEIHGQNIRDSPLQKL
jgi:hypothetical protein